MLILVKLFIDSLVSVHILTINENGWSVLSVSHGISTHEKQGNYNRVVNLCLPKVRSYGRLGNSRAATPCDRNVSCPDGKCADPRRHKDDRSIFLWGQTLGVCCFCVLSVLSVRTTLLLQWDSTFCPKTAVAPLIDFVC